MNTAQAEPLRITFIRTSCLLLEHAGRAALTDPWFARTMRGLPVFRRPGVALGSLPPVDLVIASHLHPDHFDRRALARMKGRDLVVAGTRGTGERCESLPVKHVVELSPWEEHTVGPFALTAAPAEHTGPPPAEVSFIVDCGPHRVYFGGDVRWSTAFAEIAERFGRVDVALIPVGGTLIFGHRTTMSPAEAAKACGVLGARFAIPIHEGGEWLPVPPASWHPGRRRRLPVELRRAGVGTTPVVLTPGETAIFEEGAVRTVPFEQRFG